MNPLAWIVRRWPRPFRLEWVVDEVPIRTGPNTYDMRPVRYLSSAEVECVGGWEDAT